MLGATRQLSVARANRVSRAASRSRAGPLRQAPRAAAVTVAEKVDYTLEEFESLLGKYKQTFSVGENIRGTCVVVDKTGAWIDVGAKQAAFLPADQASVKSLTKIGDVLSQGESVEAMIIKDEDGKLTLSIKAIQMGESWEKLRALYAEDAVVQCDVINVNRGGLICELEGVRGFMPLSHLAAAGETIDLVGETIDAKFLECDEEAGTLVLSNRKASAESDLKKYTVGSVVTGKVASVMPYGAFINVGTMAGLLHISQISDERITSVQNVLQVGDELKVLILSQDSERGRLSLSTKKLEPTPGDMLKNPQLVFDKAEEMAEVFRQQMAAAEAPEAPAADAAEE